ncbi:MAG: hypothetical protein C4K48_06080 [Candidatus Thorarchaeota archaeon]|nr:MAG: hypothetical protein C4K48_06080 [Candidatus Thorarchaeota archaeon]
MRGATIPMWLSTILLIGFSFCIWVFTVLSLQKQLRFATLLFDLLPYYPILELSAALCFTIGLYLWLPLSYVALVGSIGWAVTLLLMYHFIKWGKGYSLDQYRFFLRTIKDERYDTLLFNDHIDGDFKKNKVNVLLRHDVDISLFRARRMYEIEKEQGIRSTYFFRMHAEKYSHEEAIPLIRQLHVDGFGIGMHYDMLSFTKGDKEKAIALFREDLVRLREIATTHIVCPHGHRKYKNREIWSELDRESLQVWSAYDMKYDFYISDAGGGRIIDSQGRHILGRVDEAKLGQVVQVLIHPDWWF